MSRTTRYGLLVLFTALGACDGSPQPTYGVDTTLNDSGDMAASNAAIVVNVATLTDRSAGFLDDIPDDYRPPRSGTRSVDDADEDESSQDETEAEPLATPRTMVSQAAALSGDPGRFFGPDSYPPAAQRAGEQGRVVAKLSVGTDGRVSGCSVSISSGSADLDDATCRIALRSVRFSPARDETGEPVESSYTLPIRWSLPQD